MKTVKAICPAVILAFVLSVSAFAGDMQTPGKPLPPPQPSAISDNECAESAVCPATDDIYAATCADILLALTSIF
jgi:hypothetical protein